MGIKKLGLCVDMHENQEIVSFYMDFKNKIFKYFLIKYFYVNENMKIF